MLLSTFGILMEDLAFCSNPSTGMYVCAQKARGLVDGFRSDLNLALELIKLKFSHVQGKETSSRKDILGIFPQKSLTYHFRLPAIPHYALFRWGLPTEIIGSLFGQGCTTVVPICTYFLHALLCLAWLSPSFPPTYIRMYMKAMIKGLLQVSGFQFSLDIVF